MLVTLSTPRRRLRPWQNADFAPFAALNADPQVMKHFPPVKTRAESDSEAGCAMAGVQRRGRGFWAVEVIGGAPFIGFNGLAEKSFAAPFSPCVEVGWRLDRDAWGQGYATEAAGAARHRVRPAAAPRRQPRARAHPLPPRRATKRPRLAIR